MELFRISGTEIASAIAAGAISASDAVGSVLGQIDALNPTLNAFVTVDDEGARAAAATADDLQARGGELGPLHGVPFSVKDLVDTAGVRTTYGSRALADNVPERDAAAVARLRDAGAILIGKTTTPEFAAKVTTSSAISGVTPNPWNVARSPGGSSGGAGVAIATGMGPLAVSTDGSGSARIPAAACGVLGLKGTIGRIPHETWPDHFANNSSISINTRTAADLAAMLGVMSGAHPFNPWSRRTSPPIVQPQAGADWLAGRRVLHLPALGGAPVDPEISAACDVLVEQLANAGALVERREDDPIGVDGAIVRGVLIPNLLTRMRRLPEAQQLLLEPTFQALVRDPSLEPAATGFIGATLERAGLYDRLESLFADAELIVSPTILARPPLADPEHEHYVTIGEQTIDDGSWFTHLSVANMTGFPAISIPAGFTSDGLPIGLHALAGWDQEQSLIDLAAAIEQIQPWAETWPDAATSS